MPNSSTPSVTFWGAARTVTGSMHLLETGKRKVLLDCGFFQGHRAEARQRNSRFPFDPRDIDALILSHAHIDHCGNIPNFVRQGFAGPIYCTPATRDLMAVMLADSANIQQEDAEFLNRKKKERGEARIEPLYDRRDVLRAMKQVEARTYWREHDLGQGWRLKFVEAGHLLGSAMVHLSFPANGQERTLTFTGDVGRKKLPILRDPSPLPPAEIVISESTYGGRTHPPAEEMGDALCEVVRRTFDRGGKLLIPAFALGRTQTIVYFLHSLITADKLRDVRIYVDSPLASATTQVFRLHPECFDEETGLLLQENPDVFGQNLIRYVGSVEESMDLNHRQEPCIIIAASGMCESGRILHHLRHNIEDARNTVLIIGYQAPDTLGRRLVERRPEVRIHDRMWRLNAEVVVMNGFSSHADQHDLLDTLSPLAGTPAKVRLVHGEPDQAHALMAALTQRGVTDVGYPERGETVEWD